MSVMNSGTRGGMAAVAIFTLSALNSAWGGESAARVAPKPLYRDPLYDGAADPTVIFDRARGVWRMFYTNRRANAPGLKGVAWAHGTRLGIAESADGGVTWTYQGVAELPFGEGEFAFWAPDIVFFENTYHLFVTYVPGIHEEWSGPRSILHFTSPDLSKWAFVAEVPLTSNRVIDPAVMRMPNGTWRMWYKDEDHDSHTYVAESADLNTWSKGRPAEAKLPCEGANVFFWKGRYWLITDMWDGMAVYSSGNAVNWKRQRENILKIHGTGPDDTDMGRHADVVVSGGRAFIFYFTHPGRAAHPGVEDTVETRRSSIQGGELLLEDGILACYRDQPAAIKLEPPISADENGAPAR